MKRLPYLLSIITFLFIWQLAALYADSSLIICGPVEVVSTLFNLVQTKEFWLNILFTFVRVMAGFSITLITGTILGFVRGKSFFWDRFLDFPFSLLKTTPVAALILILIFAFNSNLIPVISSVLMCLPVMSECVKNGIIWDKDNLNQKKLYEMAEIFRFSKTQKFVYIFFPAFRSFFNTGICSTFGMCWKVVAAGEILTVPRFAAGTFLYKNQVNLETSSVFAMTIVLVVLSSIFEGLLKWLLKTSQK